MDTKVIAIRLQKLDDYVRHLRALQQVSVDEYLEDENLQAIVERRLQLAIQACMDIASYLVAQLGLKSPDEPENLFLVLAQAEILPRDLGSRMAGMIRLRNILVHDYLEIDSAVVHRSLTGDLQDFEDFARTIAERFLSASSE